MVAAREAEAQDPFRDPKVIDEYAYYMTFADALQELKKFQQSTEVLEAYFREYISNHVIHPDVPIQIWDVKTKYGWTCLGTSAHPINRVE